MPKLCTEIRPYYPHRNRKGIRGGDHQPRMHRKPRKVGKENVFLHCENSSKNVLRVEWQNAIELWSAVSRIQPLCSVEGREGKGPTGSRAPECNESETRV
ncbi:hypothetical protein ZHAS_00005442 [Anopheles sinensis]|uniref:Uncharacterized protein n=1 Tax=Anopheles sinensis TaxID=74873 RepID=A0A084VJK4_ANOSI|nr:hypothetical protein ZHAS_00005442 [Anopheles sinensis]